MLDGLPEPPRYTPWLKGRYEVAPNLRPFGTDFGHGLRDQEVFQISADWEARLRTKAAARRERLEKYVLRQDLTPAVEESAVTTLEALLRREWPMAAGPLGVPTGAPVLALSDAVGEAIHSPLDWLVAHIPPDLAVVEATPSGEDRVSYLNLCSPSHWAATDKIGRSFFDIHTVVPGFERANLGAAGLVKAMVERGPWVRFVWGVESDSCLNHHPEPPPGEDPLKWNGRQFENGRFWVRFERQVIWPMPRVRAALFLIAVGHVPDAAVMANPEWRESLLRALESMSPEARAYKGLVASGDALIKMLREG